MKLGEFEEAVAVCERALRILEREGNDESTTILADTHKTMGSLHKTNGHNDGALEHLTRALELLEKVYGSEHPKYATVCKDVAEMLCFTDDKEKLRSAREKAEKASIALHTRQGPRRDRQDLVRARLDLLERAAVRRGRRPPARARVRGEGPREPRAGGSARTAAGS